MSVFEALRDNGIVVVDSRVKGRPGRTLNPLGQMLHHTASRRTSGDVPSLGIVQHGRPDVRGPLCHLLIGRRLSVHAITDGGANHSGAGSAAARLRFLNRQPPLRPTTADDDRHISDLTIGIEIENDGVGEPWAPGLLDLVERVSVVLCREFSIDPMTRCLAHREWTRRKIDPTFDVPAMRQRVATALSVPTPAPTPQEEPTMIVVRHANEGGPNDGTVWRLTSTKRQMPGPLGTELAQALGQSSIPVVSGELLGTFPTDAKVPTVQEITAAIIAAIPASVSVDLTDTVTDAVAAVFAQLADALDG